MSEPQLFMLTPPCSFPLALRDLPEATKIQGRSTEPHGRSNSFRRKMRRRSDGDTGFQTHVMSMRSCSYIWYESIVVHVYIHIYIYIHIYVCIYIRYVCYKWLCIHCIYTYLYTYIRTYIHTSDVYIYICISYSFIYIHIAYIQYIHIHQSVYI